MKVLFIVLFFLKAGLVFSSSPQSCSLLIKEGGFGRLVFQKKHNTLSIVGAHKTLDSIAKQNIERCISNLMKSSPFKLCVHEDSGEIMRWSFHLNDDDTIGGIVSFGSSLPKEAHLSQDSSLCGEVVAEGNLKIYNSLIKGKFSISSNLVDSPSEIRDTIISSIFETPIMINGRFNIQDSIINVKSESLFDGIGEFGLIIHRSKIKDKVKLVGNVTITDSSLEGGSLDSHSNLITVENNSILKGNHDISRIARIDNSTVEGTIKIEGTSLQGIEIVNSNIVHDPSLGEMKFQGRGYFLHLNSTGLNSFEGGYFGVRYTTLSGNNSFSSTNYFELRNSVITGEHDFQVGNLFGSISFSYLTPLAGNKNTLIGAVSLNNCEISGIYNSVAGFGCFNSNISGNLSIHGEGTNYIERTTVEGTNILNISDRIAFQDSVLNGGATFQGRMNINNSEFSGDTYIQGDGNISASKFLIEPGKILDMRAKVFSISDANFSTTTEFIFDEYTTSDTKFFGSIKASGRLLRLSDSEIGADAEITGDCNIFYSGSKVGSGTKLATISTTYSNCFEFRGVLISPDLNVTLEPIGNNSRSWCSITYSGLNPYCAPYTSGKDGIKGNVLVNYGIDPAETEAIESQLH